MLRAGYINFWSKGLDSHIFRTFVSSLVEMGFEFDERLYDPTETVCDFVICSVFGDPANLENILGDPICVCYSGENRLEPWNIVKGRRMRSLSFKEDSKDNLYYPLWADALQNLDKRLDNDELLAAKKEVGDFCTFIVSNPTFWFRNLVFLTLDRDVRKVWSCGSALNNTGWLMPRDIPKAIERHRGVKFNLCFENSLSKGDDVIYVTEKLPNAFIYGTVPIYWGDPRASKWFNPKAYVNCYGKGVADIVAEVKRLDNDFDLYAEMLCEPVLNDMARDYFGESRERMREFLRKLFR